MFTSLPPIIGAEDTVATMPKKTFFNHELIWFEIELT